MHMIITDISNIHVTTKIKVKCDECDDIFERTLKLVRSTRKKRNADIDYCPKCSYKLSVIKKPQCNKEYWNDTNRKLKHSLSIKNSKKYYDAIKDLDRCGEHNSMFGKKHSSDAISKMVKIRTGKKQSTATVEKRRSTLKKIYEYRRLVLNANNDIQNINRSIRWFLNSEIKWYKRIYERDNFKCVKCDSTNKIDAHHIKPLKYIIKELIKDKKFNSNKEQYNYLITCPEIIDINLQNGITLCRACHKKEHINWGSHNIKTK